MHREHLNLGGFCSSCSGYGRSSVWAQPLGLWTSGRAHWQYPALPSLILVCSCSRYWLYVSAVAENPRRHIAVWEADMEVDPVAFLTGSSRKGPSNFATTCSLVPSACCTLPTHWGYVRERDRPLLWNPELACWCSGQTGWVVCLNGGGHQGGSKAGSRRSCLIR